MKLLQQTGYPAPCASLTHVNSRHTFVGYNRGHMTHGAWELEFR
jgi:hypothetical protein